MLPNLYALRFFLAILVVIYHIPETSKTLGLPYFGNSPIFEKGNLSVFFFFTLSGFLIIRLLFLEIQNSNSINLKRFYLRRIQRLYPVYYLVFFIGIFLYHFILPFLKISFPLNYSLNYLILHYIFFIPNVFNYYYRVGSINNIMWSIGVEEQFYIFMPLILYFFKKKILVILNILMILSIIILVFYYSFYKFSNYYFYFLAGGISSILAEKNKLNFLKSYIIRIIIIILFVLVCFTNFFNFSVISLYHLFNIILSALLITSISYFPLFEIKNNLINYLGKISYGIYMYHMIVVTGILFVFKKFTMATYLNQTFTIVILNFLIILFTILIAHLSYKFYEKRFYKIN